MPGHLDNSWTVFCESMHRANCRVTDADIRQAIEWFIEATGKAPKFIALHPKNAGLAIPAGMELRVIGGCLRFEIWLADRWPVKVCQDSPVAQRHEVVDGFKGCNTVVYRIGRSGQCYRAD